MLPHEIADVLQWTDGNQRHLVWMLVNDIGEKVGRRVAIGLYSLDHTN